MAPGSVRPGGAGSPAGTRSPGGTIAPGSARPLGGTGTATARPQGSPIPQGSVRPIDTGFPAARKTPVGPGILGKTGTPAGSAGSPASSPAGASSSATPSPDPAGTTNSAGSAPASDAAAGTGATDSPKTTGLADKPGMPSLSEPFAYIGNVDPASFDLKGQRKSRMPVLIAVGVVAAGVIGFLVFRSIHHHNLLKTHAAFMEEFQNLEKQNMGAFWTCVLGSNADPGSFNDNLALGGRIEGQFAADPLEYPDKVINDCIPKLQDASTAAGRLHGPDDYDDALATYNKSIPELDKGIREWAERAKSRGAQRDAEKKITAAGNAFHSVAGDAPPEAVAYDRFLRCAFSNLDRFADGQALVENLFNSCKDPAFVDKMLNTCSKVAGAKGEKADARFKGSLKKFGEDDRDMQAWDDCFRKARKGAKQDDLATFGKAWVDYLQAGGKVREVGAGVLKGGE